MTPEEKSLFLFEQAVHFVATLHAREGGDAVIPLNKRNSLKIEIELAYRMLEERLDSLNGTSSPQPPYNPHR
ncbi:hypothetical protein [Kluyvera intermedia]|uniref:hypothetical protein n=1 Tax=Kluyvera intermedia TaxID=61648 RepID=UPI003525DC49